VTQTGRFRDVLLGVWREACRHIEISGSLGSMARMLAHAMPLAVLAVREFDVARGWLHTVAAAPPVASDSAAVRAVPTAVELKRWLAWCRLGEVGHRPGRVTRPPGWAAMIPGPADRSALIGPLTGGEGPMGVAVVIAPPGVSFEPSHVQMLRALLEPLATALENDRRVRELKAMRETAEADRQSLLVRLGRRTPGDTIVGGGTGLRLVMERVGEVARTDVPVLILGEPGSGKEVIARAVHAASARASGPFIRVNCGAIPPAQVEVHLFGATLDAGSGAEEHHGWLHRATGGTVFLDEIGALPWAVQERLLHVLAQGQADPRAAAGATTIDVRVVAASDQDLASLVREGRFRQDLWYRLAAFPILLPPLRERQEDIPALARHFAQRAALRFGLPLRMPSADDLTLLMGYSWPGNARELGAVIDRAALLSRGERLEIARALGGAAEAPGATAPAGRAASLGPLASLDEAMRHHIEAALALTEGRIEGPQGAARLLKINPHTLRARMRKLRIDWGHFRSLRDPAEPR